MVGKLDIKTIDKIETPPDYRVQSTVETHDEQSRQGGRQDEDEYSASSGVKGWQKFHTDSKDRRALKMRRKDVEKIFFNQVFLQKGLVILDANLRLVNKQVLRHVHLFSTSIDAYWKLKNLTQGSEIPVNEIIKEEYIEISVLQKGMRPGTNSDERPNIKYEPKIKNTVIPDSWSLWPLRENGRYNWMAITVYTTIIILLIVATAMMV